MSDTGADAGWGRRKLIALLIGATAAAAILLAGLAIVVINAIGTGNPDRSAPAKSFPIRADGLRGVDYRNSVAARPMLQASASDLKPAPASLAQQGTLVVDPPTDTGKAHVSTGFPHSKAGAVAQLAAIEVATLIPMSIPNAKDVFTAWSEPGASFRNWELAAAIRSFQVASKAGDGDRDTVVTATPVGAQVKGSDGPDWVLACVQLDMTIKVAKEARFGYGHCSRMQWSGGRWLIGSGTPPTQAPSTWPGSQRSVDAGWLRWVERDDS